MGPYASDILTGFFGLIGARMVALTFLLISMLLTTEFLAFSAAAVTAAVLAKAVARAGRFAYEAASGRAELPGRLSIGIRKRPPKVEKTAKRLKKEQKAAERRKEGEAKKKTLSAAKKRLISLKKDKPKAQPDTRKKAARKTEKTQRSAAGTFRLPSTSLLDAPKPVNRKDRRHAFEDMSELLDLVPSVPAN